MQFAHSCETCGARFLGITERRFCSIRCSNERFRKSEEHQRWRDYANSANLKAAKYGATERLSREDLPPAGPCAYCGGSATSWDHIIPLIRGGPNALRNLAPTCMACNQAKNRRTAEEWAAYRPLVALCGWCWSPVVRRTQEIVRAEQMGFASFYCTHRCRGLRRQFDTWVRQFVAAWRPL